MKDLRERLIETLVRQSQDGFPISAALLGDAAKRIEALEAIVERVRTLRKTAISMRAVGMMAPNALGAEVSVILTEALDAALAEEATE